MTTSFPLEQWQGWWKHNGSRELRDLLLIWWDPIGVYGEPEARDEYDGYAGPLARMLRDGAREPEVIAYLREVEENRITVSGDAELAARKIVEWHDRVLRRIDRTLH
jgi:hypothetical protein